MNRKATLKYEFYRQIKEKIISCEYMPGTILTEGLLSEEYKNSRTPIREAIGLLESEGFVKVLPKKGIFVSDILLSDVFQIFQVRVEIEPLCLRLGKNYFSKQEIEDWIRKFQITDRSDPCYKELDSQMHLFLIGKCRNKYLIDMMQTVFDFNRRIVNCSTENTAHIEEARGEHLQLLSLLLEEKYEEAENVMRIHISHCQAAAIQFFCVPPELR